MEYGGKSFGYLDIGSLDIAFKGQDRNIYFVTGKGPKMNIN